LPARPLRWTEHAVAQLAAIAEYISLDSLIYAEQLADRLVARLEQARHYPESGRVVPEVGDPELRELIDAPYRLIYRVQEDALEVLSIVHARRESPDLPTDS
jgi:plasmid stabilization system protein ParE